MRNIAVVTVGRSDYGLYRPVLKRIQAEPGLRLHLIVAGMHFLPQFGNTVKEIEADGFVPAARVRIRYPSDRPEGIALAVSDAVRGFARVYARRRPDLLVVLGDRFEMFAAALAALPFNIPVAHIHGGELTRGAIDDALRHAVTKLSHLHFVSTRDYARRVVQLGEAPWRVRQTGAPGLDNLHAMKLRGAAELKARHRLRFNEPPLLVTYHPETLAYRSIRAQMNELLAALHATDKPVIFTMPNADTGHRLIVQRIRQFVRKHPRARLIRNLGTRDYFSLMALASAMVGNSSSGIIEAASFRLPVVNIGLRQAGRVRARNVIDVVGERRAIASALVRATRPAFRRGLRGLVNPYGSGRASGLIVERLKSVRLDDRLLRKEFYDLAKRSG